MRVVVKMLLLNPGQVLSPVESWDMVLSCLVLLDMVVLEGVYVGQVRGWRGLHGLRGARSREAVRRGAHVARLKRGHHTSQIEVRTAAVEGRYLGEVVREVFMNHSWHFSGVRFYHRWYSGKCWINQGVHNAIHGTYNGHTTKLMNKLQIVCAQLQATYFSQWRVAWPHWSRRCYVTRVRANQHAAELERWAACAGMGRRVRSCKHYHYTR